MAGRTRHQADGLDGQGVLSQEALEQRRFQARAARATANAQAAALKDAQTLRAASRLSLRPPASTGRKRTPKSRT